MRRTARTLVVVAVLGLAAGPLTPNAAHAEATPDAGPPPSAVAALVNEVAGAPTVEEVAGDGLSAVGAGPDAEVSADPDAGAEVTATDGSTVSLGVPGDPEVGEVAAGNMVYEQAAPDTAVAVRPTAEGVQSLVVIDGAEAPTEFAFPVQVDGADATLRTGDGGVVEVIEPGRDTPSVTVTPAWATDANGNEVPSHFEIRGSDLVQIVDHEGAAYPVVADPNTCGWVTCTYYFGKKATRDLASVTMIGAVCSLLWKVPPAAAGCAAMAGIVGFQAVRARNRNMCVKIKYSRFPVVWYPDIYSNRSCRW